MGLEQVFTQGNLVDVNISMWAAERRLQPEDLGMQGEQLSEAFTLGRKKLIPPEVIAAFKHLDYRARSTLEKHSFPFGFGGARFVPKKVFMDFVTEINEIIKEFDDKADDFARKYKKYKLEMREWYLKAAHEAYRRQGLLCGGTSESRKKFIETFLDRVDKFYPKVSEIRNRFRMEFVVFQAALPDLTQASYADLAEEGEKIKLMQAAYEKTLQRKVQEFVDNATFEMRNKANEVLTTVMASIKKGTRVSTATLNSIRKMIDEYQRLDIVDDHSFKAVLDDFKVRVLDRYTAKQFRDDSSLRDKMYKDLKAISTMAADEKGIAVIAKHYRERIGL